MRYKLTRLLLLCLLVGSASLANAQVLVHYWNFNNSATQTSLLTPNLGSGNISHLTGGISAIAITSNTAQGFDITNPNARNGDLAGTHLRFNDPIGGQLEFSLPTNGFENVVVRYATRRSGSGAGTQYISYSTDGSTYTLFDSIFPVDGNPVLQTLNFSSIAAANNNANFKIRIAFAQGAGGTVGNNRFDNFTLEGTTPPQLVHYWNFNNSATQTSLLTPNQGNGSISHLTGGISAIAITSNTAQGFDITNPNARNGDVAGTHLRFNDPIGGQLEFSLPTSGFQNAVVRYATRRSGSGAGTQYISYSTDGSTYTLFDSIFPVDGNPVLQTLNFSNIAAANNNANFKIRIAFAQGSGGTVGNNRFDNFTLEGTALSTFVPYTLQILHASDMEGGLDAPKDAPNFAAVIDSLEGTFANTVILSSGDNIIPSPFLSAGEDPSIQTPLRNATNLFYPGTHLVRPAIGRSDIAILNLIGFNASVFGNHEFDLGTGELNSMIGVDIRNSGADKRWVGAQFPFLSANLNFNNDVNLSYLVTPDGQADTSFRTAANITANSQKKGIARSAVITRGGQKIGIVGATTQVLASISSPGATTMVGPSVNDMPALAAILQPVIDSLRIGQGINKIIVLSHLQQLSLEQALAPLLTGVDVIIAGGSHSLLADANDILRPGDVAVGTYPQIRTSANGQPTLLVNTAAEYRYVGRLVVAFDSLGVIDTTLLNPMINGAYATDSAGVARVWGNYANAFTPGTKGANVKALTDAMQTVIVAKDGNVFGKASVFLEGRREFTRTEETNLGNLTSDANLWQARRADPTVTLSLKNGGGIRQAMGTVNATGSTVTLGPTAPNPAVNKQAGDISQLDIENSLRFNNRLSVLTIPVTGIKALLEHGVAQTAPGATPGRFPQVGGMAFSYDPTQPVNSRIRSVVRIDSANNIIDTLVRNGQIHGNPNRTYKLVTLNFLAGGGDGYPFAPFASTRVDLDTVITAAGAATFTVPGSEQDAFAEYMVVRHPANSPYAIAETAAAQDFRIQDLSRRNEGLLPPPPRYTLQILHASDMEGGLDAPKDAPNFAAVIDSLEGTFANTVVLSSGDNVIPSPFLSAGEDPSIQTPLRNATNLFYPGTHAVRPAIGRSDIAILNLIGFNASVFGNHEFDLGTGELNSMIGVDIRNSGADKRWVGAQFPFLSANLNFSADANLSYLVTPDGQADTSFRTAANITANSQKKGIARSAVITRGGQKIGIVGATTQVLASISSPGATTMVGPSVNDMPALAAILQPVIDSLRIGQGINKIIVLSHLQQLSLEQALAPLLNGVDVIIAGGSHSLLADANDILRAGDVAVGTYPQLRTGANGQPTLLVNTAAEYRYVGRLVVAFDSLGVIDTSMLNPMINGAYATDSAGVARVWGNYANAFNPGTKGANVRALTNAMQTVIVAKDGNVFGKASVFLEGRREFTRTEETNLGNLTSDANLWQARRADPTVTLSLKNGGGIRQAMGTVNATGSTVTLGPTAPNPAANKQAGDISQLDIENSLRFNNRLSVVTVPVSGVKALLEHGVAQTAPGQTPGRFPQVGGMAFSYDPSLPVNSRIRSVVRLDSLGNIVDTLVRNGQIHGNPNRTYKMVTLNFLAGGGDGYPFAANSTNRVDLDTVITAPGAATFTVPGSEQDAFAEYMVVRHPANSPYAIAETAAAQDFRIQDLSRRNEGLLPFDVANLVAPANNSRLLTSPTNSTPVQIVWNRAINAQLYKWSLTTATGNFAPGLVNIVSNNNGTDTTLTLTVSRIDSLLASLGVAPGDSINTRWTVKSFYSNGSDSTLAAAFNLRLVRDAQISNFNLLLPTSNARIVVRGPASTPVNITWQTATSPAAAPIRYTWLADPAANFNSPLLQFASDNQGANTQLSLTTGIIDSLLNLAGVPIGDSITISWTVSARSGISSKLASSPQQLRLIRVGLTSSVPSIELSKVRMYPNPSEGEVTLEASDVILLIVVRDLLGAEVLRMQPNEATVKLQLQHLPAGMYLIQGETRQGSFNERLLRKR